MEHFDLANAYADEGDWKKAAELLDGLYSLDRSSEPLRQRLLYLYRADLRQEARDLYESLRGKALQSKDILRLGAAIYEKSGMLPHALKALEAALDLDKEDLGSRLDWMRLKLRNNDEKHVARWIKKADVPISGDPVELDGSKASIRVTGYQSACHICDTDDGGKTLLQIGSRHDIRGCRDQYRSRIPDAAALGRCLEKTSHLSDADAVSANRSPCATRAQLWQRNL